jgi:hypothetical protein
MVLVNSTFLVMNKPQLLFVSKMVLDTSSS